MTRHPEQPGSFPIDVARYSTTPIQRASTVETLFPPGIIACETHGTVSPDWLFPSERECVVRAVEKRVGEFAAGRLCARAGLAELGIEPTPLLAGPDRAPIWPAGIVGSITHTDSYCLVVVGLQAQFAAIGVDAEYVGRVSPSLWRLTMRPEELSRLDSLEETTRQRTAAVIFSAKEAFFKCQYALTRSWLGFEDVIVTVADDSFEVSVLKATHPIHRIRSSWSGRYSVGAALVVTGMTAEHG